MNLLVVPDGTVVVWCWWCSGGGRGSGRPVLLLVALGITLDDEGDLYGTVDGEQFLGSVLLAMGTSTGDTGVAPAVIGGREVGGTGATMIDCGLPAGYFADRYAALATLATEAVRLGRAVTFS